MTAYTFMWKRSSYFSFSFEPCWSVKMYEVALTNYTMTMISWKVPHALIKLILPLIDACGASRGRETVTCKFWGLVLQLRTKLSDAVALLFQYLRQAISPRKGSRRIYANSEPDSRQVFSTEGSLGLGVWEIWFPLLFLLIYFYVNIPRFKLLLDIQAQLSHPYEESRKSDFTLQVFETWKHF